MVLSLPLTRRIQSVYFSLSFIICIKIMVLMIRHPRIVECQRQNRNTKKNLAYSIQISKPDQQKHGHTAPAHVQLCFRCCPGARGPGHPSRDSSRARGGGRCSSAGGGSCCHVRLGKNDAALGSITTGTAAAPVGRRTPNRPVPVKSAAPAHARSLIVHATK